MMDIRVELISSRPVSTPDPARGMNTLRANFDRLQQAEELRLAGKLDAAQSICEELLRQYPDYWGALHTLGLVFVDKEDNDQALNYLVRAAMRDPRSSSTLTALGGIYAALGAHEMAAQTLEKAKSISPDDPNLLSMLGGVYRDQREYELARDVLQTALALDKDQVQAAVGLGWVYADMGRSADAAAVFERLVRRGLEQLEGFAEQGMASLEVLCALANLPRKLVNIDVLSELDRLVRHYGKGAAEFENLTAFVRVAALDKAGRYAESWQEALGANRWMRATIQNDLRHFRQRQEAMLGALRANSMQAVNGHDPNHPISLFILGPSRSGKTTMEQLVATLDGVKRGYENPSVRIALLRTFQSTGLLTNDFFELLPPKLHSLCRDLYLQELARRAGSAKVFTNTSPTRIFDASFIATIFPNARFIGVKRDVDDTVLRMFQFKYQSGNSYSYDLKAARDHVLWYHQMIDLLAEKLPDAVRIVHYEDLIVDSDAALRTAAELCALAAPTGPLPRVGDDRGCARPYREFIAEELAGSQVPQ
jgi:tetratricopeptide (TPR) repeat protein